MRSNYPATSTSPRASRRRTKDLTAPPALIGIRIPTTRPDKSAALGLPCCRFFAARSLVRRKATFFILILQICNYVSVGRPKEMLPNCCSTAVKCCCSNAVPLLFLCCSMASEGYNFKIWMYFQPCLHSSMDVSPDCKLKDCRF